MNTTLYAVLTLTLSLLPLIAIALRDPKRLRSLRVTQGAASSGTRRLLTALTLLPGLALMLIGQWPAFLVWLGGIAVGGWILVQILARASSSQTTP